MSAACGKETHLDARIREGPDALTLGARERQGRTPKGSTKTSLTRLGPSTRIGVRGVEQEDGVATYGALARCIKEGWHQESWRTNELAVEAG